MEGNKIDKIIPCSLPRRIWLKSNNETSNLDKIINRNAAKIRIARIKEFVLSFVVVIIITISSLLQRVNRFNDSWM